MDTFSLFKFWKTNKSKIAVDGDNDADTVVDSTFSDPITEFSDGDDDDDDSFFELELTLPKFETKSSNFTQTNLNKLNSEKSEPKINSKPQSPISILRSASPKLRVFMFGKLNKKSKTQSEEDAFCDNVSVSSYFSPKSNNSSPFTVKFKIEDGSFVPKFTRERRSFEDSRRFSKEAVQKYLNFVKPLYTKKNGGDGGERFETSCSPMRTSSASETTLVKEKSSRFKVKTKRLGKSKSASAMIVSPLPSMARNDHPCDGIEGAILHCKRSLTSSTKGNSSLSRCSSDPSHEKSNTMSKEQI
ncbi:membrane-associated kinase regulator 5 [Silene latifolia]|uniref:membrane-associated kinase regulator 5 n=1 Tax=Silene latifolia TaxID=37657 RepID=UPI003D771FE0